MGKRLILFLCKQIMANHAITVIRSGLSKLSTHLENRRSIRTCQSPVVFRHKGCRFFFYSNEGNPREPLHIHARRGGAVAKFCLADLPEVAESDGFSAHELRELLDVAVEFTYSRFFGRIVL